MLTPAAVNSSFAAQISQAYQFLIKWSSCLQSPLLLVMRVWWGWSFFQAGWGKLHSHGEVTEFFTTLGIPLPALNAWIAAGVECFGGLFLLAGFASRLTTIPLSFTMLVAYITADREALTSIFSEPEMFTSATPFLFLLTSLLVLAFGPGTFSLDRLIERRLGKLPSRNEM